MSEQAHIHADLAGLSVNVLLRVFGREAGDAHYRIKRQKLIAFNPYTRRIIRTPLRRKYMKRDPIVEEIHKIREKILDECDGDIEKLMDRLKARESKDKARIIKLTKQKKKIPINEHITSASVRHR